MSEPTYKSLSSLTQKIGQQVNDLVNGKLKATDLEDLLQDVGQLQERLVILRYKAFEVEVKGAAAAPKAAQADESLANQISLIDAIQEVEKERVEHVNETPAPEKETKGPLFELPKKNTGGMLFEPEQPTKQEEPKEEPKAKEMAKPEPAPKAEVVIPAPKPQPTERNEPQTKAQSQSQPTETAQAVIDEPTLNERLKREEPVSLAQRMQKTAIPDLTKHIGIAQRFVFINELFDKNAEDYSKSIERLNNFGSVAEAKTYIRKNILPHYHWDLEDKHVQNFYELVERRYMH